MWDTTEIGRPDGASCPRAHQTPAIPNGMVRSHRHPHVGEATPRRGPAGRFAAGPAAVAIRRLKRLLGKGHR
ncbi:MAG: hypothetical protein FJ029_08495 [Actinobacteria bacterium]|nr:hypothetical protein [Actinomycetota bacterium]